jgi:hypothetical protein
MRKDAKEAMSLFCRKGVLGLVGLQNREAENGIE